MTYLPTPRWLFAVGACLALGLPASADALPGRSAGRMLIEPPVRGDFAAKMAKVTVGQPDWEVRKLLGRPDDVRTCDELGATTNRTKEIWCYGTSGHLTFPTPGCVYIDTNDRVQYVFGGWGTPPDPKLLGEEELRNLLRLIDEAPAVNGSFYNPRTVIRIVNRLQPLGKGKALAAIDEYLRVASAYHSDARDGGLFLVLRVLFEVPADPGYMPRMVIGAPIPWREPDDRKLIPRFPIVLVDDVPLLFVAGYNLSGVAESVREHVEYFRANGRVRPKPLAPPDRPLDVPEHLPDAVKKYFADPKLTREKDDMLNGQLFRLVYSVYRKKGLAITEDGATFAGYDRGAPSWKEARAAFNKLEVRWDAANSKYTFRDGTTLPPPPRYPRIVWRPKVFDTGASLIIERQDEEVVNIGLAEPSTEGPEGPQPSLRVYRVKDAGTTLAAFADVGLREGGGGRWRGRSGVKLPAGQAVRAELTLGEKVVTSPDYVP